VSGKAHPNNGKIFNDFFWRILIEKPKIWCKIFPLKISIDFGLTRLLVDASPKSMPICIYDQEKVTQSCSLISFGKAGGFSKGFVINDVTWEFLNIFGLNLWYFMGFLMASHAQPLLFKKRALIFVYFV
jgi:hypothetical protein